MAKSLLNTESGTVCPTFGITVTTVSIQDLAVKQVSKAHDLL